MGGHSNETKNILHLTPQSQLSPASCTQIAIHSVSLGLPPPQLEYVPAEEAQGPTVSRTLNNIEVIGEEINGIFKLCVYISRDIAMSPNSASGSLTNMLSFCPFWIQ
jgi:hypothetical protein